MKVAGHVESLWRYPVKSMRGEELPEAFIGFSGVYGDRVYAFRSSAAPAGFPYLTAREQERMLLYRPIFRNPEKMAAPPNLRAAEALPPGVTPTYAEAAERATGPRVRGPGCGRPGDGSTSTVPCCAGASSGGRRGSSS